MRINTNVSALNTQRQLGITNKAVGQSITRLSSGFRINRAADDAAGLGIANKLRGDIRAMTQAARNGEQANSLAQIAEGSVSGIASMLDRMKELATQANSDTVDVAGRQRLNAEFQALALEIDRTADTTQFGTTKLIDGSLGNSVTAGGLTVVATTMVNDVTLNGTEADVYTFSHAAGVITVTNAAGDKTQEVTTSANGAQSVTFDTFGITIELTAGYLQATAAHAAGALTVAQGNGGSFMVGASGDYNGDDLLSFSNIDMNSAALGVNALDVLNSVNAQAALDAVDTAISTVSESLGTIGAFQNRIENAVANLKTGIENLSASESVIRDLDMAEEMTKFSKNQILQQAGTAMLAQANSSSQNILQLLRG